MTKKRRSCKACQHEKKTEIDRALLSGEAARQVATRYGLSATGLQRHQKPIAPSLVKAREAAEVGQASNVLSFVRGLVTKAHQYTELAEKKGDCRRRRGIYCFYIALTRTRVHSLMEILLSLVERGPAIFPEVSICGALAR